MAEFRGLIQKEDNKFQKDLRSDDGQTGILAGLCRGYPRTASSEEFEARLHELKKGLVAVARGEAGGFAVKDSRFAKHLAGLKPEALDRIACRFPGDALKVTYSPRTDDSDFRPIEQGSPGQKTAAILAFLLAYGEEPMVLDQPEDDPDNHLIYELMVRQLRDSKRRRQIVVVTHNPNIVVNGDAELVMALEARNGQTSMPVHGGLQERAVREKICEVMEGGREAFELRYRRIGHGRSVQHV